MKNPCPGDNAQRPAKHLFLCLGHPTGSCLLPMSRFFPSILEGKINFGPAATSPEAESGIHAEARGPGTFLLSLRPFSF